MARRVQKTEVVAKRVEVRVDLMALIQEGLEEGARFALRRWLKHRADHAPVTEADIEDLADRFSTEAWVAWELRGIEWPEDLDDRP